MTSSSHSLPTTQLNQCTKPATESTTSNQRQRPNFQPKERQDEDTKMLPLSTIYQASLLYTLIIFAAGFILGCIRVPLIEPLSGERYAQLLEMPLMFVIIRRAASVAVADLHHYVLCQSTHGGTKQLDGLLPHPTITFSAFLMGLIGLVQFLVLELGFYLVVSWGKGEVDKTAWDWIGEMDPVVRVVFLGVLGTVPLLPVWEA
ncbi:hypothetical protein V8F06_007154 [Rhypophila decipiens]